MPHSLGMAWYKLAWWRLACCVALAAAVKVKVVMHSEAEDSRGEETAPAASSRPDSLLPFVRLAARDHERDREHVRERDHERDREHDREHIRERDHERDREHVHERDHVLAAPRLHPNDLLFPLIYRQAHINSMFKFGDNWYTWATEKRTDGSRALNYYICYDEPKHCDDVGWERTDSVPKCAFEIDSVLADDRACLNAFGVEPRGGASSAPRHPASPPVAAALCDGADQMKVSEIVRSCGPRIRSLWRFVRVGRRPPAAAKPADVNSLVCEDEEECFLSVEYRIHRDRITFSLHEPTRGQTFKSVLRREHARTEEPAPQMETRRDLVRSAAPAHRARTFRAESKPERPPDEAVAHHADLRARDDLSDDISSDGS